MLTIDKLQGSLLRCLLLTWSIPRVKTAENDLKKKGVVGKTYCAGCLPRGKNCYYHRKCERLGKGLVRSFMNVQIFPAAFSRPSISVTVLFTI